jgi:hypothetical protein
LPSCAEAKDLSFSKQRFFTHLADLLRMTTSTFMHQNALHARHIIAYILGGITTILLARLVLRLVAARPENPIIAALFAITTPPRVLGALDAGQPRFGAVLEFSTLALIVLLLVAVLLLRLWQSRWRR